jgi:hypothetical protein
MALEKPPKYLVLNPDGVKSYRPNETSVSAWHTVKSAKESWLSIAKEYGVPAARIIQFNFPGAAEDGRIVPEIVNWYLRYHVGFQCPETEDRKNRRFKGGERVAIPFLGTLEIGEPEIRKRITGNTSNLWIGVGEAHSGDLVALGYFNWNARIFRVGGQDPRGVEWATLSSHGLKLGGGLGGSGGLVCVFAHGVEQVTQFSTAFAWGDMDFDLAFIGKLSDALKSLTGVGKIVKTMEQYEKLTYVASELIKSQGFIKPGVYTIPVPFTGVGVHVWAGRKYAETFVVSTGFGL